MADNSPDTTIESLDGQMQPVAGIDPILHNLDDIHYLDPPMLHNDQPSDVSSDFSGLSFTTEIEDDLLNASNNTTNESVSFNAGRKSLKKKRKTKKRKSLKKKRRKTNKKMKGRGSSPSKMKFLREIEEELINEELGDSFFRQRSDAADDGSDVGSVDDKKSIPTTTASTPPPSPPIPRYKRVGPSDVKVEKPLDVIPRPLTSHEEVALENGLEYWPHSAGPLEGALPIPVPARAIDEPSFYSLAPITTPNQRRFEHDSSNPITVATEINRRIREEPTGERGQIGYLQLTPSDLALLQDEIKYAPIRQAEEDEEYARRVQRRQERNFINQDEEYARRVQNELDGNTRRQTRCRGRRCTISGGKRKTKKRKSLKKRRKTKRKGG